MLLQNTAITGLMFLLAILDSSCTAAVYTIYGALLGGLFAMLFGLPLNMLNIIGSINMRHLAYILTLVITCLYHKKISLQADGALSEVLGGYIKTFIEL